MMAWAFTGPIPGRASSCSLVAVLIFTFCPGASFVTALEAFSADLAAFGRASFEGAAGAGAVAYGYDPATTRLQRVLEIVDLE